jgi:hypothetical protein
MGLVQDDLSLVGLAFLLIIFPGQFCYEGPVRSEYLSTPVALYWVPAAHLSPLLRDYAVAFTHDE